MFHLQQLVDGWLISESESDPSQGLFLLVPEFVEIKTTIYPISKNFHQASEMMYTWSL
jgi:hypothetical protein